MRDRPGETESRVRGGHAPVTGKRRDISMIATEWGTGQVFLSMLWFFIFVLWIWFVVMIFTDIFRSRDLSGGAKALWCIFVIFLPFLGCFVYLIARGKDMTDRAMEEQQARAAAYYRSQAAMSAPGSASAAPSNVDQLSTLVQMRDQGVIDDAEFQKMKGKLTAV
jgi:hypothetical protein